MNITLSVPPAIVQNVRAWAEKNNTTLNALVRAFLEEKSRAYESRQERLAAEFAAFASTCRGKAEPGWKFNRAVDGNREMKCLGEG